MELFYSDGNITHAELSKKESELLIRLSKRITRQELSDMGFDERERDVIISWYLGLGDDFE